MDLTESIPIQRITREGKQSIQDTVVKELPLTIIFNNRELVTLLCSPVHLEYLAVGFLASEGFLKSKDAIKKLTLDDRRGVVRIETDGDGKLTDEILFKRLITSGCGRGASFYSVADSQALAQVRSDLEIPAPAIFNLVRKFQHRSQVYRTTGGVHSAALCDAGDILVFNEDIGRHNAVDKVFGQCILNDIPTDNSLLITSGRVSSEIVVKVARRNVPILVSKSAPTNLGVKLANDLGVTLIGFARGERMNVYTHHHRIKVDGK